MNNAVVEERCPTCEKPLELCMCSSCSPQQHKPYVLILQHPQEPDKELGTARLTQLNLKKSVLRTGLSWRNLTHALGEDMVKALGRPVVAGEWVVLYLGSGIKQPKADGAAAFRTGQTRLQFVDKKSQPCERPTPIVGIVVLDGSWSQAKSLWWRNAWLLKLKRAVLLPAKPSLYGKLRKEPRRECLSTLESVGASLTVLGENPAVEEHLKGVFQKLLEKHKEIAILKQKS